MTPIDARLAVPTDVPRTAALHALGIGEGFLPTLGPAVLQLLHRRMVIDPSSFVIVASDGGVVQGFVAGTTDTGALYRAFLRSDGLKAALLAIPKAPLMWRRALETLRYPHQADPDWPSAELLAIAVNESLRGQGVGRELTRLFQKEIVRRGSDGAKVVVGENNAAAVNLYRSAGFRDAGALEVHRDKRSKVLVWP